MRVTKFEQLINTLEAWQAEEYDKYADCIAHGYEYDKYLATYRAYSRVIKLVLHVFGKIDLRPTDIKIKAGDNV